MCQVIYRKYVSGQKLDKNQRKVLKWHKSVNGLDHKMVEKIWVPKKWQEDYAIIDFTDPGAARRALEAPAPKYDGSVLKVYHSAHSYRQHSNTARVQIEKRREEGDVIVYGDRRKGKAECESLAVADADRWSCSACTYSHEGRDASFLACEMCQTPRGVFLIRTAL